MLEILGRIHVLILHLPIGILAGVVAVELWAKLRKDERVAAANGLLSALLALSAIAAAITGLVLGRDQSGDAVFWHRWTGVGLAVLCCGVAWLRWRWQSVGAPGGSTYAGGLAATAALTVVVGHLGGSITHGDDFLWPEQREPRELPTVPLVDGGDADGAGEAETVDVYAEIIAPLFADRCNECHGPNKQKGGLRLDSPRAIMAGGHSGASIVIGHPEQSLLVELISLPPEDADIMPSKGDPLTPDQVAAISDWIAAGAPFGIDAGGSGIAAGADAPTEIDRMASTIPPAQEALLRRVVDSGLTVTPLSDNGSLLDVDAGSLAAGFGPEHITLLRELRHNVAWLDLGRTPVGDDDLFFLAELPNLQRLQLHQTAITDAALPQIAACTQLRYLNLFGTAVSDAGVGELSRLDGLEALYIWQTKITQQGAEVLQKALPGTEINRGE